MHLSWLLGPCVFPSNRSGRRCYSDHARFPLAPPRAGPGRRRRHRRCHPQI